jgi:hypothetical protein
MTVRALKGHTAYGGVGDAITQLQGLKQLRAAAGAAAGVKATITLADGAGTPLSTLQVDARLPGQHGNAYHLVITRTTGPADAAGLFFDLLVYAANNTTLLEEWRSLSMLDTSPNYCETRINGKSDRIVVTDLDSATADQRPSNKTVGNANLAGGAGEFTVTGLVRGQVIMAALNVTDATLPAIPDGDIVAVDTDKAAVIVGGGTTASKALLLFVMPA